MSAPSLVMPMAGRGSRFAKRRIIEPKPLVDLLGKPFFWWAVESVRRVTQPAEIVFVVLEEHIAEWRLDRRIREFYPAADILAIPDVTSGSAETAALGVAQCKGTGPVMINDCDHAFVVNDLEQALRGLNDSAAGALMTFRSDSPNYSFVELAADGSVAGTVEKRAVSPFAIAGCYLFATPTLYRTHYETYIESCPYNELYISGIYNQMLRQGLKVDMILLEEHFAFGTPEEYAAIEEKISRLSSWQ